MAPGHLVLWFGLEEGVCHAEIVIGAQFQKALAVVIDLASAEVSKADGPGVVISPHPGVEITEQDDVFLAWGVAD